MFDKKSGSNALLRIMILVGNFQYLFFIFCITLCRSVRDLAASVSLIYTTNQILTGRNAIKPLIIMIAIMVISIPLKALENHFSYAYRAKAHERGMKAFLTRISEINPANYEKETGEIISICTADYEFFLDWITTGPGGLIRELSFLIGALLYSYTQNVMLTNIIFPIAILTFPAISFVTGPIKKITEKRRKMIGAATSEIQELLSNPEFIKSYNLEEEIEKKINKNIDICYTEERKEGVFQGILEAIKIIGSYLPGVLAAMAGAVYLFRGQISAGFILGFVQMTVQRFKAAVPETTKILTLTSQTAAICNRICDFLYSESQASNASLASECEYNYKNKDTVYDIRNVSFGYDGNDLKLSNVNLNIKRGEKLAIIGASGSGKSTLLKILSGICKPAQGQIFYQGQDISQLDFNSFSSDISLVFQTSFLFKATIRENISGKSKGDDGKIWISLERAGLADFVMNTPKKLDTLIDESGANFSGGQRQRLAIARALYKDSEVLILDEPYSALDMDTAEKLNKTITSVYHEKTIIMVTHRIADIISFDRIIVMRNGKIILDGKYAELFNQKGEAVKMINH